MKTSRCRFTFEPIPAILHPGPTPRAKLDSVPPASNTKTLNLYGLERDSLTELMSSHEAPAFHAVQIYGWLYSRRRFRLDEWTDLPRSLRAELARKIRVAPGTVEGRVEATDGTVKYRIALAEGGAVEAVHMVHRDRVTLCLSSQVGCSLDCDFCLTGKMGLTRHMSAGEIVGQVALIQEDRSLPDGGFNLVFMGMGEPLQNYDAVLAAFRLLTDPEGFGFSRKRITFSTAGMAPAIERLALEPRRPRLAVSLNATRDELRSRIMPINHKYPLSRLLEACRVFCRATRERITFEYVLLHGINDSDEDTRRLAKIVHSLPAKLNLIPFNAVPGLLDYHPPSKERVAAIRDGLLRHNVPVSVRWSRGAEARAACGQLALLPGEPQ